MIDTPMQTKADKVLAISSLRLEMDHIIMHPHPQ
jgi:hypothetical protein